MIYFQKVGITKYRKTVEINPSIVNNPLKRFDVVEKVTKFMAFEESIRAIMTSNPLSTTSKGQRIIKVIRCHFSGIISNACCILWQLSTVISEFLFKV
jgi:hypothetical protein